MSTFPLRHTPIAWALGLALIAGLTACGSSDDDPAPSDTVSTEELRAVTLLDKQDWKFVEDDALTDAAALSADASSWASVTLPHSWNARDAASIAQTTPTSVSYKRGKGWYRLEFDNPGTGATQWLQFDGASIVADVWLNGRKLGQHKGAFTTFRFDVTRQLNAGRNVLLVKADNSRPTTVADLTAIIPLSGDFNMSGGLYRSVSLVSTPAAAHLALDDLGSSGVYARTVSTGNSAATVNVRAKLRNDTADDGNFTVRASLVDAAGNPARTASTSAALRAGQAGEVAQDLVVDNVHLWNGVADPYLYKLVVELRDGAGAAVDRVVQDFGVRETRFDPDDGFFLNGRSMPLHGVNMHQDYQDMGWAIGPTQTDESLALIQEIGANTVRLAHYPHAQYTLQQTDKLGFVVWAELPYVNQSAVPCEAAMSPELVDNARLQLQELIRQRYNHSSIAMWSIGNETTQGSDCTTANNPTQLLPQLQALARAEDPSRPTTLAANKNLQEVSGITDIWALNQYHMWYPPPRPASGLGDLLDQWHAARPDQPVGVSEYGGGGAITHHSDNLTGSIGSVLPFDPSGRLRIVYQPEGYAGYVHEENYAVMASRPYVWGTYVWAMFDFGSDIRHEGDIGGTNTKGLVTFDRNTKKDPFYFYKATWSKTPVTHIVASRYVERNQPTAEVKVYSNADAVTLKVNGNTIKTLTAAECPNHTCRFGDVKLAVGDNAIEADGLHGGSIVVADSVVWNLDADHAANIYIAAGQIATGFASEAAGPLGVARRFGSDNYFSGGVRKNLPTALWTSPLANLGSATVPAEGRVWDAYREEATGGDASAHTAGSGFSYRVDLVPGASYTVTLGFLEAQATAAVQRVFNVAATTGGVTRAAIVDLDVFARAGGGAAHAETFPVTIGADGKLDLDFVGQSGKAMVSNIMIVKQ